MDNNLMVDINVCEYIVQYIIHNQRSRNVQDHMKKYTHLLIYLQETATSVARV